MQPLAGLREVEAARAAINQFLADGLLQPLQRHADSRLLQQKPVCRRRDAAFLDQHNEGAQEIPVEIVGEAFEAIVRHGKPRSEGDKPGR